MSLSLHRCLQRIILGENQKNIWQCAPDREEGAKEPLKITGIVAQKISDRFLFYRSSNSCWELRYRLQQNKPYLVVANRFTCDCIDEILQKQLDSRKITSL